MNTEGTNKRFAVAVSPAEAGNRLDRLLATHLAEFSRSRLQALIRAHKVTRNGVAVGELGHRVKAGEIYTVDVPSAKPAAPGPEAIPLAVVYEDAHLIVIDKPKDLAVHPGPGHATGTLVNALIAHCGASLSGIGGVRRPGIVHRLDKDTSGLIVVAKNDLAHRRLARQFASREVRKTYLALVHGEMKKPQGTIDAPIGRDPVRRARMSARRTAAGRPGRPAITHWKVLQKIEGRYGKFSLLVIRIETGRTHQIRVHLASIGHPVVGDTLYGAPRQVACYARPASKPASLERNFLHASGIQFRHPTKNAPLSFHQALPRELESFFRRIAR